MSAPEFLTAPALEALGIEHGLGTLRSQEVEVPGLYLARQVHGTRIARVPPPADRIEADALISDAPGAAVGVRTADCVPLLLAARAGGPVAAVHAGWRGSAGNIAEAAVRALHGAFGVDADALVAVIGPHIGPCCYEVDAPVRRAISDAEFFTPGRDARHWHLDLGALNRSQLERAGLPATSIHGAGGCTACQPELYASYRRDGTGVRMVHWLRARIP